MVIADVAAKSAINKTKEDAKHLKGANAQLNEQIHDIQKVIFKDPLYYENMVEWVKKYDKELDMIDELREQLKEPLKKSYDEMLQVTRYFETEKALASFPQRTLEQAEDIDSLRFSDFFYNDNSVLVLIGASGIGKTKAICEDFKRYVYEYAMSIDTKNKSVSTYGAELSKLISGLFLYTTQNKFINDSRKSMQDKKIDMTKYVDTEYLIIDDFKPNTDFTATQANALEELFSERYELNKKTIVVSVDNDFRNLPENVRLKLNKNSMSYEMRG